MLFQVCSVLEQQCRNRKLPRTAQRYRQDSVSVQEKDVRLCSAYQRVTGVLVQSALDTSTVEEVARKLSSGVFSLVV
jgi:hypothetical protein